MSRTTETIAGEEPHEGGVTEDSVEPPEVEPTEVESPEVEPTRAGGAPDAGESAQARFSDGDGGHTEAGHTEAGSNGAEASGTTDDGEVPGEDGDEAAADGEAGADDGADDGVDDEAGVDDAEPSSPERPGLEKTKPRNLSEAHLRSVLESLVFVADKPITAKQLARVVRSKMAEVQRLLEGLADEYRGRGVELAEVAGGWQFRTAAVNAPFVRDLVAHRPVRLTRAQLETLAICAYRQPVTRPEIEEIRGVDSGSAVKVLADRGLIKIIGRKDEPGRPLLYGTTPAFLEFFGLRSLKELPTLQEFSELSDESRALFERKMGEPLDLSKIQVPDVAPYEDDDEGEESGERAEADAGAESSAGVEGEEEADEARAADENEEGNLVNVNAADGEDDDDLDDDDDDDDDDDGDDDGDDDEDDDEDDDGDDDGDDEDDDGNDGDDEDDEDDEDDGDLDDDDDDEE